MSWSWPTWVVLVALLATAACSGSESAETTITTSAATIATTPTSSSSTTSSTTSTTSATTTTEVATTTTTLPKATLDERPLVWFQPLPPREDPTLPFGDGSDDFYNLFLPGAEWDTAARRIDVFGIYTTFVRHYATDSDLVRLIDEVDRRGLLLGMEIAPLPVPSTDECVVTEGFGGSADLAMLRRIVSLGGTVDVVALNEPYAHAVRLDGPLDCGWSVDRVAEETARFVTELRRILPDVVVGDIEPFWSSPQIDASDMAVWLDAYEAAVGEPLAFLHLDADWNRPDWPAVFREVEEVADERGVPIGVIYYGGETSTDAEWTQLAVDRAFIFEEIWGGTPEHVVIQSWNDHPWRVMPDGDPSTLTGLVNRYFAPRTSVSIDAAAGSGTLTTADGLPVAGATLRVTAAPTAPVRTIQQIGGLVPQGAEEAVIAIRANTEGAGPGPADVSISSVSYTEDGGENLVAEPEFERGFRLWGTYGEVAASIAADTDGSGNVLRVVAAASDSVFVDSAPFTVTPGARFELAAEAALPESASGTVYVSVVFLGDGEIDRAIVDLRAPDALDVDVTTTEDGGFVVPTADLAAGSYEFSVAYPGTIEFWPSWEQFTLTIP